HRRRAAPAHRRSAGHRSRYRDARLLRRDWLHARSGGIRGQDHPHRPAGRGPRRLSRDAEVDPMTETRDIPELTRRGVLAGLGGTLLLAAMPVPVRADQPLVDEAIRTLFLDKPRAEGRITLTVPPLAETGNNVPIKVT